MMLGFKGLKFIIRRSHSQPSIVIVIKYSKMNTSISCLDLVLLLVI